MIRRIISTVIVSALVLMVMPLAYADGSSTNTQTFYSKTFKLDKNKELYSFMERFPDEVSVQVTDTQKAAGKYSLYIDSSGGYNGKSLDSGNLEQYFGNTAAAYFSMPDNMKKQTEYSFSVKVKIGEGGSLSNLRIMQTDQPSKVSVDRVPPYYFFSQMEITEGEDGWSTYSKTFNSLSNEGPYLHLITGGAENVYIDDLYFKDNTNNVVLLNYGFEDVEITDMYEPTGIEALSEEYGEMEISWRNPANYNIGWNDSGSSIKTSGTRESGILNISLYDVTGSENPETEDLSLLEPIFTVNKDGTDEKYPGVNTVPNELSKCVLTGLGSNTTYKFVLAVTTDKTNQEGTVTNVVSKKLITGTTLEIPEGWTPPVETLPNFHHIIVEGFMNDAENTNDPSLNIAFWNPKSDDIAEITLDKIIDGECIRISGTNFNLDNNAVNEYEINELVKGEKYQFKLNCTFGDGTIQSAVFDGVAGINTHPSSVNGWVPFWSVGAAENAPAVVRMDTTEKYSGESSMYLSTSFASTGRYIMYQYNNIVFQADASYKIGFWAKANNCKYIRFYAGWGNAAKVVQYTGVTDEWEYHEITMNNLPASGTQLLVIVNEACEDLWLDDITTTKIGEDKNLIATGDCEVESNDELEAVLNIKHEAQDEQVKLTWTNAQKSLTEHVNIYDVKDGKQSFKGRYSENEAIVYDLVNDNTHTLVLKAVDANGREGKAVKIEVTPTAPTYSLKNPGFDKNTVEAGEINAFVTVKNKSMGDNFKVTLIAALYDGYEMVASNISENTVSENMPDGERISVNITVPDDAAEKDYVLKFFMWDTVDDKNILRECEILR